jgi:hypothetical protein
VDILDQRRYCWSMISISYQYSVTQTVDLHKGSYFACIGMFWLMGLRILDHKCRSDATSPYSSSTVCSRDRLSERLLCYGDNIMIETVSFRWSRRSISMCCSEDWSISRTIRSRNQFSRASPLKVRLIIDQHSVFQTNCIHLLHSLTSIISGLTLLLIALER